MEDDDKVIDLNNDGKLSIPERIASKITSGKFIMVVVSTVIFNLAFFNGKISSEQYITIYTIMVSYYFTKNGITQSNVVTSTDDTITELAEIKKLINTKINVNTKDIQENNNVQVVEPNTNQNNNDIHP